MSCRASVARRRRTGPVIRRIERDASLADRLKPLFRVALETTREQSTYLIRRGGGQRCPIRIVTRDCGQRVGNRLAREHRPAGKHLVEHAAERPDVGAAGRQAHLAPVRGSCRPRVPRMTPDCVAWTVGEFVASRASSLQHGSIAFASPKSSTFTVPSGRTLMFAGFRSRWTIPCSCAASRASATCRAIDERFHERDRPLRNLLRQRRPLDQFHHERQGSVRFLEAVDLRNVRMVERCPGPRPHAGIAPSARYRSQKQLRKQHLHRNFAFQLRISGSIHLAHPTGPVERRISYGPSRVPAVSATFRGF